MSTSMVANRRFILPGLPLLLGLGCCLGAAAPPPTSNVVAPTLARPSPKLETARRQYRQFCAACHDADFSGTVSRDRGRDIPDFRNGLWHTHHTDAKLVVSILEGKGTLMPSFAQRLSEAEARDLVSLIRQANAAPPEIAKTVPADFESRFAALCEEMEALKKQYHELDKKPPKPTPNR